MNQSRYQNYLRQRYRALFGYTGTLLMILGGLLAVPVVLLPFFWDELDKSWGFLLPGLGLALFGYLLKRKFVPKNPIGLSVQEGMVIVLLVWLAALFVGALPFMFVADLSFSQAVFETTSGWTTTGLTVVDVTTAPKLILFYRSFIQMAGGAGFAIIALTAISGPSGAGLNVAEGRGDQLAPHVRQSSILVLRMYLGYITFGILALFIAGMAPFDALNHAFTAVATGGFSTRPESIAYWDSHTIELIIIVLMILGNMNFLTAYTLFNRKFEAFYRNGEIRLFWVVTPISILLIYLITTQGVYPDFLKDLRVSIFEPISAITGTGFSTTNYIDGSWNGFGWLLLIILMTIGGGTGSTAGGLKQARVYILTKALRWEFRRSFMPQHTVNEPPIWQGEQRVFMTSAQVRNVALFVFLYLVFLAAGTLATAAHGYSIDQSLFEFASALGTVGLSVGVVTPSSPDTLLWTNTIGMFMGRLEFFAIIVGVSKIFIDMREMYPVRLGKSKDRPRTL